MTAMRETLCMIAAAIIAASTVPAFAEPEIKFPIVFNDKSELEKLGLSIELPIDDLSEPSQDRGLRNACYFYGDGMQHFITVSDDFLARYAARGFTRRSLCMALVSEARFDPETGQRLPTYIYKYEKGIIEALDSLHPDKVGDLAFYVPDTFKTKEAMRAAVEIAKQGKFTGLNENQIAALLSESHAISAELPLAVPDCFKNGTPFLDCKWRYGLMSGKKLSDAAPVKYRQVGEFIDRQIKDAMKHGDVKPDDPDRDKEGLQIDGAWASVIEQLYEGQPIEFRMPLELQPWAEAITWYDVSPDFLNGYGYALNADGSAGNGVSLAGILTAHDGSHHSSRISESRILNVVKRP